MVLASEVFFNFSFAQLSAAQNKQDIIEKVNDLSIVILCVNDLTTLFSLL